ncbi:FAD binding domain-containing protein [Chelatococcus reniformis]|uniref:Dehydrogenase n=1 Tax=Chelatococcus reniformis TaxID=1494448 RepID=A0A916USX3_9HYPH|nr:xanthine dehydrogenase family protein subunit M [Chelatococcus reniformis]GGC85850.1 dehydrogenase [Chelatococcus reniformis]
MIPVGYVRASSLGAIPPMLAGDGHRLLGGGTNLVDLMRKGVERPSLLIDVTALPATIEEAADGGLVIGAAARNSAVAAHPLVRVRYPILSRAILSGASAQIRNMATVAGNLMQRTRCVYFNDVAGSRCNKRAPGSGCDAIGGFNRYHAILGASSACIATHPSDMCVALAALDARIRVDGPGGARTIPIGEFHRLPGDTPEIETALAPGEVIVAVEVPASPFAGRSTYRKVRDRASFAFALVSVAAGLTLDKERIADIRIAFGGVAPKPWRALQAEALLRGGPATSAAFEAAAAAELAHAEPLAGNAFKRELAKRSLSAILAELAGVSR